MCKERENNRNTEEYMKESAVERGRRLAFLGVQIQYTWTALVVLFFAVLAVMVGLYLYICKIKPEPGAGMLSFTALLQSIPVYPAFLVLVLGSQVILALGFVKQEKNSLTMQRVLLSPRCRFKVRLCYSLLVSVVAFLFYFAILCVLLILDATLYPESFYGVAEWYPAFTWFRHLFALYPVANPWAFLSLPACVMAVAQISTMVTVVIRKDTEDGCTAVLMTMVVGFIAYTCAATIAITVISFVVTAVMGIFSIRIGVIHHKKGLAYEEA